LVGLSDKEVTCGDCGSTFTFTVGEQEFFATRGFTNEPKRCLSCRSSRRSQRGSSGGGGGGGGGGSFSQREMFEVECAECGTTTTVPFQPRGIKPVYCQPCFAKVKAGDA